MRALAEVTVLLANEDERSRGDHHDFPSRGRSLREAFAQPKRATSRYVA